MSKKLSQKDYDDLSRVMARKKGFSFWSNLKDIITDLIGAAIWVITLIMIYCENIVWLWEGVTGMVIGGVFFLLPDKLITDYLKKFLRRWVDKAKDNIKT